MVASFHCCGTSPPVHTSTRMAWKRSRTKNKRYCNCIIYAHEVHKEEDPNNRDLLLGAEDGKTNLVPLKGLFYTAFSSREYIVIIV